MSVRQLSVVGALSAAALLAGAVTMPGAAMATSLDPHSPSTHVLLLSVDGLHQSDLDWYVTQHPTSDLSKLINRGNSFTRAQTPVPSDSFPGMVGQVTGGNPKTTGIYYDDSYNHALLPAGTTHCAGVAPGVEVNYSEAIDRNQDSIKTMYAGAEAAKFFGSAPGDPAVPDIYAVAQHGVVYTGGTKKIAEHGGADPQDRNVPLVISGAGAAKHTVHNEQVQTTQIAPTILALLGLNPHDLQAVQAEQTRPCH